MSDNDVVRLYATFCTFAAGTEFPMATLTLYADGSGEIEHTVYGLMPFNTLADGIADMRAHMHQDETQTVDEALALRAEIEVLHAELERERKRFPADGLWVVKSGNGGMSESRISHVADLPEPVEFAAIAQHREVIAVAIRTCWHVYREQGHQSPLDVADAIIAEVHRGMQSEVAL